MGPENPLKVQVASDLVHEKVFAEIYYGSKFVALVSQEDHDCFLVELPGPEALKEQLTREIPLQAFQEALEMAVERLTGNEGRA